MLNFEFIQDGTNAMKTVLKHIVGRTYKPLLQRYLSKTRVYRHGNIRLEIPPQVFHPGFFFSTRLMLQYAAKLSLPGKKFLELGAGSGLIAIYAAGKGAQVTATDINPVAVEYLRKNCDENKVMLTIFESDLFTAIPSCSFDIIFINPPYYKQDPSTLIDYAWFCGKNGEYFSSLFSQLRDYIHPGSEIIMVLCESCDLAMIETIAAGHHFGMQCIETKDNLLEKNFIYKIQLIK